MAAWDKLKPFGFCVHGAIDGYSRKILLLEVGNSSSNPKIIAEYYLGYVRQIGGTPVRIVELKMDTFVPSNVSSEGQLGTPLKVKRVLRMDVQQQIKKLKPGGGL